MNKPIFVATHPRACSTAFERVFMTRDDLQCIHEPFGDAFYFGPERLSDRYGDDEQARLKSGFAESTYKTIFDRIEKENVEGKRLFIKDITHYLIPPDDKPAAVAPSLLRQSRGIGTKEAVTNGTSPSSHGNVKATNGVVNGDVHHRITDENRFANPTVVPETLLRKFHFTFLIRHPRSSIPSYYRCTIPPLDKVTGFYDFLPSEAGYAELRRFFDYLRNLEIIGPDIAASSPSLNGTASQDNESHTNGADFIQGNKSKVEICLIDADDLLDNPSGIIEAYCKSVGIDYTLEMLKWNTEKDHKDAKQAFEKWTGFHEDAIHSTELKARTHKKEPKTDKQLFVEWTDKFGEKGAHVIKDAVDANVADYEYLKQFALRA